MRQHFVDVPRFGRAMLTFVLYSQHFVDISGASCGLLTKYCLRVGSRLLR